MDSLSNSPQDILEFDQDDALVEVPPNDAAAAVSCDMLEFDGNITPVPSCAAVDSLEFDQGSEPSEVLLNSTADATPCDLLEFDQDTEPSEVQPKTKIIELNGEEFWPLSGKPYFHTFITEAVFKRHQLVVPTKIHLILPTLNMPLTLTYCGKKWEMLYSGKGTYKRINHGWKAFSVDNNLKIGDACVFELVECTSEQLTFRVQILRGDIPSKFQHQMNGEQADTPIFID